MFKIVYVYFYDIETTFEFEHILKETVSSLKLYIIINKYMYMWLFSYCSNIHRHLWYFMIALPWSRTLLNSLFEFRFSLSSSSSVVLCRCAITWELCSFSLGTLLDLSPASWERHPQSPWMPPVIFSLVRYVLVLILFDWPNIRFSSVHVLLWITNDYKCVKFLFISTVLYYLPFQYKVIEKFFE